MRQKHYEHNNDKHHLTAMFYYIQSHNQITNDSQSTDYPSLHTNVLTAQAGTDFDLRRRLYWVLLQGH